MRRLRRAIDRSRELIERSRQVAEAVARTTAAERRGRAVRMSLRAMRETIPNFIIPTRKGGSRALAAAASVPPELVERVLVTVRNCAALVRGGALDPAETRDLMSYAAAFAPVADEIDALAYFVRHSIASAKHKVGTDALTTYALAQRLAKLPETADLAPAVADMRRILASRRKSAKSTSPAPVPPVTPVPKPVIQ